MLAPFNGRLANLTPLRFLAAGYADPHTVKRLGVMRVTRFLVRHSRNAWNHPEAEQIMAAARESSDPWADGLDFGDLAEDVPIEALVAQRNETTAVDVGGQYGLGMLTYGSWRGHLGGIPGWSTLAFRNADTGAVVVMASNAEGEGTSPAHLLLVDKLFPGSLDLF